MDTYKCGGCGEESSESFKFCPKCGREFHKKEKSLDGQLVTLLRQGQKIAAVKLYRERTGVGLKEAHIYIKNLAKQNNVIVKSSPASLVLVVSFAFMFLGLIIGVVIALFEG